jgi:hypothetical protein
MIKTIIMLGFGVKDKDVEEEDLATITKIMGGLMDTLEDIQTIISVEIDQIVEATDIQGIMDLIIIADTEEEITEITEDTDIIVREIIVLIITN